MALVTFLAADWIKIGRERDYWQARIEELRREHGRQRELEQKIAAVLAAAKVADGDRIEARGAFLASLSAVLPDDDWLTELSIRRNAVALRGYSANAENLLKAIEPLARDRTVTLQGDVMFDSRLARQRFSIAFQLRGDGRE